MVAHFCNERAEVRLVTSTEKGEFGTGTRHLHHTLKRLAVIEPTLTGKGMLAAFPEKVGEIFQEIEDSHNILVTSEDTARYSDGFWAETRIVRY